MKLLTVKEVAEALNVSQMTIYKWKREGKIKAIKIGRAVRIDEKELERFVEGQVIGAP